MVLDITENDELIPILGRDWSIGISGRWFAGRPNGEQERREIIRWIETADINAYSHLEDTMIWAFAKILDCRYQGYRQVKPNSCAYVYTFYMPAELSKCPNSQILIVLNKKKGYGIT